MTTRETFRLAVADVATKAKNVLPEAVNGRVEAAVKLVLAGDVLPQDDGSIHVDSSDPARYYVLQGPTCTCTDFTQGKAPEGWCKHRIAAGIEKRVRELLPAPASEPEASAAIPDTLTPHMLFLHGKPFVQYAGLLQVAHERGLVSLTTKIEFHSADLVLASATATFADGRSFTEWADATPSNVKAHVRPHFPRMALTRAKARCLRDALSIGVTALEELGEVEP
jgi:hypothetical protein